MSLGILETYEQLQKDRVELACVEMQLRDEMTIRDSHLARVVMIDAEIAEIRAGQACAELAFYEHCIRTEYNGGKAPIKYWWDYRCDRFLIC